MEYLLHIPYTEHMIIWVTSFIRYFKFIAFHASPRKCLTKSNQNGHLIFRSTCRCSFHHPYLPCAGQERVLRVARRWRDVKTSSAPNAPIPRRHTSIWGRCFEWVKVGSFIGGRTLEWKVDVFHQKLNGTESQRTPKEAAIELLDAQV